VCFVDGCSDDEDRDIGDEHADDDVDDDEDPRLV
jgi:hypothetical protein